MNILCFGDSNTYGVDPVTQMRLPREKRWTGILQGKLGDDHYVIEEGLGGRTTVWDDPLADNRNGIKALPLLLDSHSPIDLIFIMLGGNDWKHRFSVLPEDTVGGIEKMVQLIRHHIYPKGGIVPQIGIIAPVPIGDELDGCPYYGFTGQAIENSRLLPGMLKQLAEKYQCLYFNAGDVACADEADQMHMNTTSHVRLAEGLYSMLHQEWSLLRNQ